jgi:hypothetical protein
MNCISTAVCRCCDKASWNCPSCGLAGHWPVPSPAPAWPVEFAGACPSCRTQLSLRIVGYGAQRPEVAALERALKLPPAVRENWNLVSDGPGPPPRSEALAAA